MSNTPLINVVLSSYKILNPAAVAKESDEKKCAAHILDNTGLDPENYRLGHTKACSPYKLVWTFCFCFLEARKLARVHSLFTAAS